MIDPCALCNNHRRVRVMPRLESNKATYFIDCPKCRSTATSRPSIYCDGTPVPTDLTDTVEVKGKFKVHGFNAANHKEGEAGKTMFHDTYDKALLVATSMVNNAGSIARGDRAVIYKAIEVVEVDIRPVTIRGVK